MGGRLGLSDRLGAEEKKKLSWFYLGKNNRYFGQ
jgi:hypothetical protein